MKLIRVSTIPLSLSILLEGQLKYIAKYYNVIAISSNGIELDNVAKREGVKTVAIDMERNISILRDLRSLYDLYRLFKEEKPEIVHSITPKAGLLSMIAAKAAGIPIRMHSFTGLIFPYRRGFIQKLLISMDRLLCWSATNVYPEGEGVKKDLIKYKITNKQLKVLANGNVNGINTEYFNSEQINIEQKEQLKTDLYISEKDFVFAFVGRLVKDKGINELVSAFSRLKDQNTKLILVGIQEEELDPLLPETLKEINTNKNIISVGWQSDVRPYFVISDALVFPSYREGFPNVVMQAGAMGLPSIVTDISGCNEIIINNVNGIIIPPKDENKLYEAMLSFLNDPQEVDRLANNSRKMIVDRYEQHVVWDALLKEYKRLEKELLKN